VLVATKIVQRRELMYGEEKAIFTKKKTGEQLWRKCVCKIAKIEAQIEGCG